MTAALIVIAALLIIGMAVVLISTERQDHATMSAIQYLAMPHPWDGAKRSLHAWQSLTPLAWTHDDTHHTCEPPVNNGRDGPWVCPECGARWQTLCP